MQYQFGVVLVEHLWQNAQAKVNLEKKLRLEVIHLLHEDPAHLGVVGIIVIGIVEEFCRQKYSSDDYSMDIQFGK